MSQIFTKGDVTRHADTPAEVAQLKFDGFREVVDTVAPAADVAEIEIPYADLQREAKELGIPANQSAEVLEAAINAAYAETDPKPGDAS